MQIMTGIEVNSEADFPKLREYCPSAEGTRAIFPHISLGCDASSISQTSVKAKHHARANKKAQLTQRERTTAVHV